ncbi:hypothetical protein P6P90_12155 [Ectobacillus antri]|jgi:alanyl-tRNA synthetase|uniref:Uncharacterized protein n=1 Tax=Ectobacillus antri TaxID=2486280 RepID=A0ABT6H8D1_9BACI|nr:hypothetical protein [Ectobacillus antri]MDG4657714.1 hypothetical protein [Ectobacillus antri]MDG5754721.1 hypothetical protein [Ectobacillus antri]
MRIWKSKSLWGAIGAVALSSGIAYQLGTIPADVKVKDATFTYEELLTDTAAKEKTLASLKQEVTKTTDKLEGLNIEWKQREKEFADAKALVASKASLEAEITAKQNEVSGKAAELTKLASEVEAKQAELQKLTDGITLKKQEPKKLGAGTWYAGKDIPAGRYKITGNSNFVTFSASGKLKVNTILGSQWGIESYVADLADGDIIETHGGATFQAIE